MVGALQIPTISPGQLISVQPGQLTTTPGVGAAQTEIGDLLTSIMPLIMIMMVFMMIMPMMKGMSEGFTAK